MAAMRHLADERNTSLRHAQKENCRWKSSVGAVAHSHVAIPSENLNLSVTYDRDNLYPRRARVQRLDRGSSSSHFSRREASKSIVAHPYRESGLSTWGNSIYSTCVASGIPLPTPPVEGYLGGRFLRSDGRIASDRLDNPRSSYLFCDGPYQRLTKIKNECV